MFGDQRSRGDRHGRVLDGWHDEIVHVRERIAAVVGRKGAHDRLVARANGRLLHFDGHSRDGRPVEDLIRISLHHEIQTTTGEEQFHEQRQAAQPWQLETDYLGS